MMRPAKVWVAVLAGGVLLAGMGPATAGEQQAKAMSTAQARKVFLRAVCPLNEALAAQAKAEADPAATWATVQPVVRESADMQMRASRKLAHPKRPWPADVRAYIPALAELDLTGAGSQYTLASAASLDEYKALLTALQDDLPATLEAQVRAFRHARRVVHKRLHIFGKDACGVL